MRIIKAILLTALLLAIQNILEISLFVGLDKYTNLLEKEYKEHVFGMALILIWISFLIVTYFFWKPRPNLKSELNIKQLDFTLIPYLLIIVIGLGFVTQPIIDFNRIIDFYLNSEIKPHYKFHGFSTLFIYFRASSILFAPIFEELFFRKFLFLKLLEKNKVWIAILISSLCFSAIHFPTPNNLIPTFIYGVIACIIYLKTKNIVYLIIIHFLNNLCSLLYAVFGESFYDWVYGLNYDFMYWALFIFGILITILGVKKITITNKL
ncbi:type II CAAX endopeptidase family protein [Algibacter aquimarinus]|uniref:CAAX prenyl protease 2/Lysostaphin resistance protein A-like domain-containing protein n=1 Tax=Algibacter aquimarinus TaxID=1136748 RepID=A0ABP9HJM3_9FLAO